MFGAVEGSGLVPRAFTLLFEGIEALRAAGWEAELTASHLELYNETIRDLLSRSKTTLELRSVDGKFTVPGLLSASVNTPREVLEVCPCLCACALCVCLCVRAFARCLPSSCAPPRSSAVARPPAP